MRELRARGLPRTLSLAVVVADLLVLVGGGAFAALVLKLQAPLRRSSDRG